MDQRDFKVQTVAAFGESYGVGNLAGGFALSLQSPSEGVADRGRFIMGSALKVEVAWAASFLPEFSITLDQCTVTHGDVEIQIIKERAHSSCNFTL